MLVLVPRLGSHAIVECRQLFGLGGARVGMWVAFLLLLVARREVLLLANSRAFL
jgi:hypothetical protein